MAFDENINDNFAPYDYGVAQPPGLIPPPMLDPLLDPIPGFFGPNAVYAAANAAYGDPVASAAFAAAWGMSVDTALATQGIAAPDRRQLVSQGIAAGPPASVNFVPRGVLKKKFPATKVTKSYKMHHQSGRGGHIAYIGQTEAAYFTRKPSANAFVRSWNEMISHLGSAASFDQLKLASLFAAVLQAGSGAEGQANGFSPPLNGQ